jgi:hypothetical protein
VIEALFLFLLLLDELADAGVVATHGRDAAAACPEMLPDEALSAPEVGPRDVVALLASTLFNDRGIRTTFAFAEFGRDRGMLPHRLY